MTNSRGFSTGIAIIVILIATFGGYYFYQSNSLNSGITACSLEAKACSDGSTVGRTGPNCEFVACPSVSDNEDIIIINDSSTADIGIFVTSPKENESVIFPVTVQGQINGNGWFANEGEVGTVQIFDSNNKSVSNKAILRATTNWLQLPTNFEGQIGDREMISYLETDSGYLLFTSRGAKDGDVILSHKVPVVFRKSALE